MANLILINTYSLILRILIILFAKRVNIAKMVLNMNVQLYFIYYLRVKLISKNFKNKSKRGIFVTMMKIIMVHCLV